MTNTNQNSKSNVDLDLLNNRLDMRKGKSVAPALFLILAVSNVSSKPSIKLPVIYDRIIFDDCCD